MQNGAGQRRRTSVRKRLGSVLAAAALSCAAIVASVVVSWMSCKGGDDGCGVGLLVAAAAVVPAFLLGGAALVLLSERTSSPILTNVITALAVFFALIPLEMVFLRQIWAVFAFSGLFAVFVAMVLSEPGVTTLEKEIRTQTPPAPVALEPGPAPDASVALAEERADALVEGSLPPSASTAQAEEPVSLRQEERSDFPTARRRQRTVAHRRARDEDVSRKRRLLRRRPDRLREDAARAAKRAWRAAAAESESATETGDAARSVREPDAAGDNGEVIERLESSVQALERLVVGTREREPPREADASRIEERLQELSSRVQSLVERVETADSERGSGGAQPAALPAEEEMRLICRQAAALLSRMNGHVSGGDLELQLLAISGLRRRLMELSRQLEGDGTG